jgi:hypothetical protein
MGYAFDPYNPHEAIDAQAHFIGMIISKNKCGKCHIDFTRLWLPYQAYNGGWDTLYSEYGRAKIAEWIKMRAECRRRILTLKGGRKLNLCDVNYSYSKQIFKYGSLYRTQKDQMKFW